jgi:DNA polymerase III subunit delta
MAKTEALVWHALDFSAAKLDSLPQTVVLTGHDPYLFDMALKGVLRCLVGDEEDPIPPERLYGKEIAWSDLSAELAAGSLFSQGTSQPVLLTEAAPFISKYRGELESWVANPTSDNTLILLTDTWQANTKLYKLVQQHGAQVQCDLPTTSAKSKATDSKRINKWIVDTAKDGYQLKLGSDAASLLWDFSQDSFGMVDTSLAKLSLLFPAGSSITAQDIRTHVGGWKAESTWQAIDMALDGHGQQALQTLYPIFHAGEHPLSVMGQMSWALRRYAVAYDHYNQARLTGGKPEIKQSLLAAGFREWGSEVDRAGARLKRLGRRRLDAMHRWLLDIDLALKNTHSDETNGRVLIERLILQLAE